MEKKEEELLGINYRLEKATVKLQNFEREFSSIAKNLKKARRHRFFLTVFFILLLLSAVTYLFVSETLSLESDKSDDLQVLQWQNDSLKEVVEKLKAKVSKKEQNTSIPNTNEYNTTYSSDDSILTEEGNVAIPDSLEEDIRYDRKYAYVKNVRQRNNVNFIEVDFIDYYEGKKAVLKATEMEEAEYEIDKNNDTLFFLFKNYYIHNPELNTVILELAENVRVNMINQSKNGFSIRAFQEIIKDNPVMILTVSNGIVYAIKKQDMP